MWHSPVVYIMSSPALAASASHTTWRHCSSLSRFSLSPKWQSPVKKKKLDMHLALNVSSTVPENDNARADGNQIDWRSGDEEAEEGDGFH